MISTSALELGIDVGGLDVCILVGYPGSQIATWQRAGRVGRTARPLIALIAQPDALDQYLVAHPEALFRTEPSSTPSSIPTTPRSSRAHLPCAAAEVPLRAGEAWLEGPAAERGHRAARGERRRCSAARPAASGSPRAGARTAT